MRTVEDWVVIIQDNDDVGAAHRLLADIIADPRHPDQIKRVLNFMTALRMVQAVAS